VLHKLAQLSIDETRANFYKKEHTQGREREKKKKRTKIKVQASKQPQKRQTTRRKVNH
jgi:hypothetical protein